MTSGGQSWKCCHKSGDAHGPDRPQKTRCQARPGGIPPPLGFGVSVASWAPWYWTASLKNHETGASGDLYATQLAGFVTAARRR